MTASGRRLESRLADASPPADDDAATTDDDAGFGELVLRHRRELRGHCYRLLRSTVEADDAVQETLVRAWRARASFAGRATLRTWLYRIATNVCLDEMDHRHRRTRPIQRSDWLTIVARTPDGQLEAVAPSHAQPESLVVAKESLTQACFTVIALLTPRQRAVLILRDVLCWSASDTATLLDTSVAAVNSALQRARAILAAARSSPGEARRCVTAMSGDGRALLDRYVDALGRPDAAAAVELVRADVAVVAAA